MVPASHFRPIGYLSDACRTQPVDTEAKAVALRQAARRPARGWPMMGLWRLMIWLRADLVPGSRGSARSRSTGR